MSVGLSFHCRTGSIWRIANLVCCSPGVTENQNFVSAMPSSTSIRSNCGACRKKASYCSSVHHPMTFSTPARLYQERSKKTISPAVGRCSTWRWKYHCRRSRSVGTVSATTARCGGSGAPHLDGRCHGSRLCPDRRDLDNQRLTTRLTARHYGRPAGNRTASIAGKQDRNPGAIRNPGMRGAAVFADPVIAFIIGRDPSRRAGASLTGMDRCRDSIDSVGTPPLNPGRVRNPAMTSPPGRAGTAGRCPS